MTNNGKKIAVVASSSACGERANILAKHLELTLLSDKSSYDFLLVVKPTHLELQKNNSSIGPLFVDFLSSNMNYRLSKKNQRELLAKAIRTKTKEKLFVIDATAGLGRDGFLLATLGCKVLFLERSKIIAALLQDGLQRALRDKQYANLDVALLVIDANAYLKNLTLENRPDVIYLDPMYPQRIKSALVKKEMQYLQEFIGKDEDASILLANALTQAKKRVIVKRPIFAPNSSEPKSDYVLKGRNTRFDIYVCNY